jgi:D-arabinose 1-dehydrogenase-like Zn-dependent alcohol dehydrogenase
VAQFLDVVEAAGVRTAYEVLPLDEAATALRRMQEGDVRGAFVLVP